MKQIKVTFTAVHEYEATIWATEKEIQILQSEPKNIDRENQEHQELFIDLIVDKQNKKTNKVLKIQSVETIKEPTQLQSKHYFKDY